jgi:hypothetical protein
MVYKTIDNCFGMLPDYMTRIMAQGPATMVLIESMRHAIGTIFNQDTEFRKWVTECSHIEFSKNNHTACSVCEGILLGILDIEFEVHLPRIHYEKSIAKGDDFCRYEIESKEFNIS